MGRKIETTVIDEAIDYFVKNKVRFLDVATKFAMELIKTGLIKFDKEKRGVDWNSVHQLLGRLDQ